mmetsp:Transcript_118666/g.209820  ORF Transcript_118666/g.209820 Transcript_118666/m.209820 type:complete len:205 (-) Transcript_118666:464-1078(-)
MPVKARAHDLVTLIIEIVGLDLGHELVVRAFLNHSALVKNNDLVCILDCCESVCNGQRCETSICDLVKRVLHQPLVHRVQCSSGFVQENYVRLPNQAACNRQALHLASTEAPAGLSQDGQQLVGFLLDELPGLRLLQGFLYSNISRVALHSVPDVFSHCGLEQHSLLCHDSDALTKKMNIVTPNVYSIKVDGTTIGIHIVEALQ